MRTSQRLNQATYPAPMAGRRDSPAKTSASAASTKQDSAEREADCFLKLLGSSRAKLPKINPDGFCLKMLRTPMQLIGGTQGWRVYAPCGIGVTLTAEGGGDVKLMFACGAVLGVWGGLGQTVIALSLVALFAIFVLLTKGLKACIKTAIPLAPFLCVGGIVSYTITNMGGI